MLAFLVTLFCLQEARGFSPLVGPMRSTTAVFGTLDGKAIDGEFVPVNNMVLVKKSTKDDKTDVGLVLTASVKTKDDEGTVVAVGTGKIHHESGVAFDMPLAPGESVLFNQFAGTDLEYNGEKHALIADDAVFVKYNGDKLNIETAEVLRDNVLVNVVKKEEDSVGGILLAKTSASKKKLPTIGEVVKVGPGRYATNGKIMEMDVTAGDMIKFRNSAGEPVEIEDKIYTLVRMSDILAKF